MLSSWKSALAICALSAAIATPADALVLVEVAPGSGLNGRVTSWSDTFTSLAPGDVLFASLDGGSACIDQTVCTFDVSALDADFIAVKAAGFNALYEVMPGDTRVEIDVSSWVRAPIGGAEFALSWPNRGGNFPGISNIRAANPIPEAGSAITFLAGCLVAGFALRGRLSG